MRKRALFRRRSPYWRRRFWDWGVAFPAVWDTDWTATGPAPDAPASAAPAGLTPAARRALHRRGLLSGGWSRRLAAAPPELIDFINRFHLSAGFERVIEDFFGDPLQAVAARMALRLSQRLAGDDPQAAYDLHFDRRIAFAPDGKPALSIAAGYRGVHYRFFPWRRFHPAALRTQLRRDALVFTRPERVRWVFRRKWLRSPRQAAARLRSVLDDDAGWPGARRWAAGLSRRVLLV